MKRPAFGRRQRFLPVQNILYDTYGILLVFEYFPVSTCSKRRIFSTEAYASDVRFFETLQLNEARD
jgi:hypothetical protein